MIPKNVSELTKETYENALKSGALKLTETESKKLKDSQSAMQYLVSYAPSLADKPESNESENKEDPFANPEKDLVVLEDLNGDGKYQLLLNKYPVIPEHTLLVTKEFQNQSSALAPSDLLVAYKYLCRIDDEDEDIRNLVFFNSGEQSGSSQNHKHLQSFKIPSKFTTFQDRLCNGKEHFLPTFNQEPLQDDKVSFAHFVLPLPENPDDVDEDLLAMCYISLLQRSLTFFQDWLNENPDLTKSYNVLLTKKWICVIPRSHAKFNDDELSLSINAAGYAGLVLAKDKKTFEKLNETPDLVDKALFECGFPSTAGQKPTEYHY